MKPDHVPSIDKADRRRDDVFVNIPLFLWVLLGVALFVGRVSAPANAGGRMTEGSSTN